MNLIVTCSRNFEEEAKNEIKNILDKLGDKTPEVTITDLSGILTVKTSIAHDSIIRKIKQILDDEPWSVRYSLRIIPIQGISTTNIDAIVSEMKKLTGVIQEHESFKIVVEKRNSDISSKEIISEIAKDLQNKVSMENPDWILLVEILGGKSGVSVVKEDSIISVQKIKRRLSE
ncbi:MAG: THUMP domain-containing protein [Nitrosopumilaceae archaeon]|nr:THUMP domain-containing protein [Nitrosopumilaceae archaeon]